MKLDVVLPAGGRINGAFAAETGVELKALLPVNGKTVLERMLEVLRASQRVERCVVIGPDELVWHSSTRLADAVIAEGETGPDNVLRGIEWLREANGGQHADRVMILTTDLPFVAPEIIEDFIYACPPDTDVCAPIISRDQYNTTFPGSRSEYVRLMDGEWTLGCAFLANPVVLEANRKHVEDVFAARKSQLKMARLLGLSCIVRFLTRRLSVHYVQRRCSEIIGCSVRAVSGCAPELAFDIDTQDEYQYALHYLKEDNR